MEKILIFETSNARDYWLKYIVSLLKKTSLFFKIKNLEKEIWLENERIIFKTYYEINEKFKAGRRNQFIIYYKNMEYRLEKNLKETLKEILLDG